MLQLASTIGLGVAPEMGLTPLSDGWFRVGDEEESPERARFDTVIDGSTLKATLFNTDFYRTFTP